VYTVDEQKSKGQKRNTAGKTVGETHPCAPGPRGVAALDKRTGAAITKTFAKVYSENRYDLQLSSCSWEKRKKKKQFIPKGRWQMEDGRMGLNNDRLYDTTFV
jgi:hypothetical protein